MAFLRQVLERSLHDQRHQTAVPVVGSDEHVGRARDQQRLPWRPELPFCSEKPTHADDLIPAQGEVNERLAHIRIAQVFPVEVSLVQFHAGAPEIFLEFDDLGFVLGAIRDDAVISSWHDHLIQPVWLCRRRWMKPSMSPIVSHSLERLNWSRSTSTPTSR